MFALIVELLFTINYSNNIPTDTLIIVDLLHLYNEYIHFKSNYNVKGEWIIDMFNMIKSSLWLKFEKTNIKTPFRKR